MADSKHLMSSLKKLPMPLRVAVIAVIALIIVLKLTGVISLDGTDSDRAEPPSDKAPQTQGAGQDDQGQREREDARPDVDAGDDGGIAQLFAEERSGVQVSASGVVVKLLRDDNEGSRHQLFLVELDSDITIKIAHNIDLAPRVPCEAGDRVSFYGVYEWSDQGGTVHWTHHDPRGRHIGGWIEHAGERYE